MFSTAEIFVLHNKANYNKKKSPGIEETNKMEQCLIFHTAISKSLLQYEALYVSQKPSCVASYKCHVASGAYRRTCEWRC